MSEEEIDQMIDELETLIQSIPQAFEGQTIASELHNKQNECIKKLRDILEKIHDLHGCGVLDTCYCLDITSLSGKTCQYPTIVDTAEAPFTVCHGYITIIRPDGEYWTGWGDYAHKYPTGYEPYLEFDKTYEAYFKIYGELYDRVYERWAIRVATAKFFNQLYPSADELACNKVLATAEGHEVHLIPETREGDFDFDTHPFFYPRMYIVSIKCR